WRHFKAHDVISMPDCWEYPWFAAWDLAYHCIPLAQIDTEFAKQQIELMLKETYLHPNGQIPAYEWTFDDVNPPVHAFGALKVFRAERLKYGKGDLNFLQRIFHKLLLNYGWWINRKDKEGHNVFEGGFLGLDNISVYNRSHPLPDGYSLKQADATGWMAMFTLNMTIMALEIATEDNNYEGIAIQCYQQFVAIAQALTDQDETGISLWDDETGFFKDVVVTAAGEQHRIDVYSMVGLIPLFACEIIDQRLLANVPRFAELLQANKAEKNNRHQGFADSDRVNENGEYLLALVDHQRLARILTRVLDENEFMSRYGIRSLSRIHNEHKDLGNIPGVGSSMIEYIPGESTSWMFGGNSNWRGPVWLPINFSLIQALDKYHHYLGDDFTIPVPCQNNQQMNLRQIADLISESL
ncbi:MAG: glucosidase, partial [Methyloprofundus sp.]|nr:glucosidase [Methyloprofundus sp.]